MSSGSDAFPRRAAQSGGRPAKRLNLGSLGPECNIVTSPVVYGFSPGYSVKVIAFDINEQLKAMGAVSKTVYEFPLVIVGDTDPKGINNAKHSPKFRLCVDADENAIHADVHVNKKVELAIKKGNAKWDYVPMRDEKGEFILKKALFMPGVGLNKCTVMNQNIGEFEIGVPTVFDITLVPDATLGPKKKDTSAAATDPKGKEISNDESSSSSTASALDVAKKNKLKAGKVKDTPVPSSDDKDANEPIDAGGDEVVYYKVEGKSVKLVPSQYSSVTDKNADIFDMMAKAIMNACYRGFHFDDETAKTLIEMKACFLIRLGGQQIAAPRPSDIRDDEESFYPGQFVVEYTMQNTPEEVECNEKEKDKEKIPYFKPNIHSTFIRRTKDKKTGIEGMYKAHYKFVVLPPTNWNFKRIEALGIPYDEEDIIRSWWANMQNIDSVGRCTLPEKEHFLSGGPVIFNQTIQINVDDIFVSSSSLHDWCIKVNKEDIINLMADETFSVTWKPRKDRFKTPGDKGSVGSKVIAPALARSNVCCINSLNSDILGLKQTITDQEINFGILLPTWMMRKKNAKATPEELRKASSSGERPIETSIKICGLWKEYQDVMKEVEKGSAAAAPSKSSGKKGSVQPSASSEASPLLKFIQKYFRVLREEKVPRSTNAEGKPTDPEPEPKILFFAYNLPESEDATQDQTVTFILKNKVPEFTHLKSYLAPKALSEIDNENAEDQKEPEKSTKTDQENGESSGNGDAETTAPDADENGGEQSGEEQSGEEDTE